MDEDADPEDVNEIDAEDEDEYAVVSRISDLVHAGFKVCLSLNFVVICM